MNVLSIIKRFSYKFFTGSSFLLEMHGVRYRKTGNQYYVYKPKNVLHGKREELTKLYRLSKYGKLMLLCLLLLLTLGFLSFTAFQTLQQIRSFQQYSRAVRAGDVNTIRPWMTIHTVSRIYHVPESYLYQELNIHNPDSLRPASLTTIANTTRQPVNNVIQTVKHAIVAYREGHPHSFIPSTIPSSLPIARKLLSLYVGSREA